MPISIKILLLIIYDYPYDAFILFKSYDKNIHVLVNSLRN